MTTATATDWRDQRDAFERLAQRTGAKLRADHQPGGWGRSERELLARLSLGDPTVQHWQTKRIELEAAAAAPSWVLRGAPAAEREFQLLAGHCATLTGAAGAGSWVAWLDQMLAIELDDDSDWDSNGIPLSAIEEVCAASITHAERVTPSRLARLAGSPWRTVHGAQKQR